MEGGALTGFPRWRRGSTSIHDLSADRGLRPYTKPLYIAFNFAGNLFGETAVDRRIERRRFRVKDLDASWDRVPAMTSPTRRLCHLFWAGLPWAEIADELGGIRALDLGCGAGDYGERLTRWSGGRITSYFGVDVVKDANWPDLQARHANFRFATFDGKSLSEVIPEGTNFIFSQSVLEHADEDVTLMEEIARYVEAYGRPVLQVHMVPSSACLRLYRYHGIRQYTPRTISPLCRPFVGFSRAILFGLGARRCAAVHYEFVSKPRFLKNQWKIDPRRADEYNRKLRDAISEDFAAPQGAPVFYALVIHSNATRRLDL